MNTKLHEKLLVSPIMKNIVIYQMRCSPASQPATHVSKVIVNPTLIETFQSCNPVLMLSVTFKKYDYKVMKTKLEKI